MILSGGEVVVMSAEDARKLVDAFYRPGCKALSYKELRELGILKILDKLDAAVKRCDHIEDCFQCAR